MSTTLRKSLRILESLALSDTPRGISELSREIKLNKSAVQRIFQTLLEEGYIEKTADTSRYKPTLRIWELGSRVIAQNEVRRLIHPILRYAAKSSELTTYFAWADYPDIIYLDKIDGEKGRPNSSDPGQRIPMHAAASGRAILAFFDEAQIEGVLADLVNGAGDGASAVELRDELRLTRQRLFACSQRGAAARISSIAAPVWGQGALPVGSVVLTSDSVTLPQSDFDRVGAVAISIAEQATRVLGGSYPATASDAP
ncbi:IclR family transcriptional regulator [Aliidongia dinghuensis]|uniref:IclR family transcriptional regulator n=1 Tax=Aliidongia dinghuensis TaxID=1867774 RepID=A0A8J2Z1H0_9PROT|nr:IclR family transcriptional regulator [Aliidongia dinghuensis]GGF49120.1 IclR family transcriptional regulator [Aliidongia dinghuensis]